MEEDIKTIQEKLKIIESLCTDDCINKSTVIQPLIYAIEKLIERYKELEENKHLREYIAYASNLDEMTATKYQLIQREGYINGVADAHQRAEQIIHENYIPKSKVKEILNKLSNHNYKCNFDDVDFLQNIIIEIHQLLED